MRRTDRKLLDEVPPVDFYVSRRIGFSETLPWESVDSLIDRKLLEREAMRAHFGEECSERTSDNDPDPISTDLVIER